MNFFILKYYVVDDYIERRGEFREEHLKLASGYNNRGELFLAGALSDPADEALLIFRTDDKSVIENFVKNDPYVINGLVKSWMIRKWNVVIGK